MRCASLAGLLLLATAFPLSAATIEGSACWFTTPPGVQASCHLVTVPALRDEASGQRFVLPVAVISRKNGTATGIPVVMVQGGPGSATFHDAYPESEMTQGWIEIASGLLGQRQVILFDARGTGASTPSLDCPEANAQARDSRDPPGSDEPFFTRQSQAMQACRQRLAEAGVTVEAVSTLAMADDIADIAAALGHDQVDLWAFSFGTRVALETVRNHPDLVHAAVLDSTMGTDGHADEDLPFMTWRSFDRLFSDCEAQPACNASYPALRERVLAGLHRMNREPERLALADPQRWGEGKSVLMSGDDLVFYVYDAFYSSQSIPYLPSVLDAGFGGNPDALTLFYWYPYLADWSLAEGAFLTVWCREFTPFTDPAVMAAQAERYGVIGKAGAAIETSPACADWPVVPLAADDPRFVTGDLPVLLINGAYDPVTPPDWAAEIAGHFPNGRHLVFAAEGHTPSGGSGCANEEAVAFLLEASGEASSRTADCALPQSPPEFVH